VQLRIVVRVRTPRVDKCRPGPTSVVPE
jgi:hypothetical protein